MKKIGALCICACMVLLSACSNNKDNTPKENTVAIMSKSEMENVKDGDTFSMPMEKDLKQEYLEGQDLIAVYSYSFTESITMVVPIKETAILRKQV